MGYQIIKERTGGTFALFSSNTDTFVMREATRVEVLDFFVEIETERLIGTVARIFDQLSVGEKPYHQFTLTLEEAEEMESGACAARGEAVMPSLKGHVIRRQDNQALNPQCAQRLPIAWEIHECIGDTCAWCKYGPEHKPYRHQLVTVIENDGGCPGKCALCGKPCCSNLGECPPRCCRCKECF